METQPKVKRVTKTTKKSKATEGESVGVSQPELATVNATVPEKVEETVGDASKPAPTKEIRLTDIPVVDEITALNLMVSFLGLAQKRGAYTIDEASKIWECIKKFQRPMETPSPTSA
jgi:hypothetical protein